MTANVDANVKRDGKTVGSQERKYNFFLKKILKSKNKSKNVEQ